MAVVTYEIPPVTLRVSLTAALEQSPKLDLPSQKL